MSDEVQISAYVSRDTKRKLDAYSRQSGVKKSRIVEDALEYHFRALDSIPAEYFVPSRIVLTDESFDALVESIRNPGEPTQALKDLMRMDMSGIEIELHDSHKD